MEVDHSSKLVSSTRHPIIHLTLSLRERRMRDHRKLALIEGIRFLVSANDAGTTFQHLIVSPRLLTSATGKRAVRDLSKRGVPVTRVTPELFRQLSTARRASGVAAVVQQRWKPLKNVRVAGPAVWLGVRTVDSPGNLGTMLRTAHAAAASGIIALGTSTDLYDPAVVRAGMGASFHLPFTRCSRRALQNWSARHPEVQVVGATARGTKVFSELQFQRPTVLLVGNERKGLSPEDLALCDEKVRIPMAGTLSSLNAAVAASLLLFESWRARGFELS